MFKKILLSLSCLSTVLLSQDGVDSALEYKGWTLSGDLRLAYVSYDFKNEPGRNEDNSKHFGSTDSRGFYTAPKVSLISPSYQGFSLKLTGAGVTDFGINEHKYERGTLAFDYKENKSFAILQEAYLKYENKDHKFLIGREEINTPMVSNDDYYILADSFEVIHYTNTSLDNISLSLGYFYKMSGVWDSGANGTQFHSMSDASFVDERDKKNADDSGISYLALDFDNEIHHFQVWNYYAYELYNTFFSQYDYSHSLDLFSYIASLQFINFNEVGDLKSNNFSKIDYSIYSVNFNGVFDNGFDFTVAVSKFSDGEGTGATLGAWGGYPYFATGMIVTWFNAGSFQNSTNYKLAGGYDFSNELRLDLQYLFVDLDSKYSKNANAKGEDYQKSYGMSVSYNHDNGAYASMTYEYTDIEHEPRINALYLFIGYTF